MAKIENIKILQKRSWSPRGNDGFPKESNQILKDALVFDTDDAIEAYKEWLKMDIELAEKVAKSFNQGINKSNNAEYPFKYAGWSHELLYHSESCHCPNSKIWLQRPTNRGSHKKSRIRYYPKPNERLKFPKQKGFYERDMLRYSEAVKNLPLDSHFSDQSIVRIM